MTGKIIQEQIKALLVYDALSDGIDAAFRQGRYVDATDMPECPHAEGTSDRKWWMRGFDYGTDCLVHGLNPDDNNCDDSE